MYIFFLLLKICMFYTKQCQVALYRHLVLLFLSINYITLQFIYTYYFNELGKILCSLQPCVRINYLDFVLVFLVNVGFWFCWPQDVIFVGLVVRFFTLLRTFACYVTKWCQVALIFIHLELNLEAFGSPVLSTSLNNHVVHIYLLF